MKEENQGVGVIESKRRSVSSWRVAQAGRQAKCQKRLYSFVFGFINMAVNFFFFSQIFLKWHVGHRSHKGVSFSKK